MKFQQMKDNRVQVKQEQLQSHNMKTLTNMEHSYASQSVEQNASKV